MFAGCHSNGGKNNYVENDDLENNFFYEYINIAPMEQILLPRPKTKFWMMLKNTGKHWYKWELTTNGLRW